MDIERAFRRNCEWRQISEAEAESIIHAENALRDGWLNGERYTREGLYGTRVETAFRSINGEWYAPKDIKGSLTYIEIEKAGLLDGSGAEGHFDTINNFRFWPIDETGERIVREIRAKLYPMSPLELNQP